MQRLVRGFGALDCLLFNAPKEVPATVQCGRETFAGFGDFIFHYDAYVVGGVGAMSVRPIPVIDPNFRNFSYEPKLAFNAGIGLRIFFNRWFAAVLEVRDYVFNDKLENLDTSPIPSVAQNPSTWYGETSLTNNVQAQFGAAIFLPFSFDYRLPK